MRRGAGVGHVLAPWPFLVFSFITLAGGALACPSLGTARGVMVAFDAAAVAQPDSSPHNPLQGQSIPHCISAAVVVEIHEHVPPHVLPLPDAVRPPAKIIIAVRARVEMLMVGPVKPDVDEWRRGPQNAGKTSAAHHAVRRPVLLEQVVATSGCGTPRRRRGPGGGAQGNRRALDDPRPRRADVARGVLRVWSPDGRAPE